MSGMHIAIWVNVALEFRYNIRSTLAGTTIDRMTILAEQHTKNGAPAIDTLVAAAIYSASSVSSLPLSRICPSLTPWYLHVAHAAHHVSGRFKIPRVQPSRQTHSGPSGIRSTYRLIEERSLSILWRDRSDPQRPGGCTRARRVSRTYSGTAPGPLHTRLASKLRRK